MWIVIALIGSVLLGAYQVSKKLAVRENCTYTTAFMSALFAAFPSWILFLYLLLTDTSQHQSTESGFFIIQGQIIVKSSLVSGSWLLSFAALKHLPLSLASPLRQISPVFTILGAMILFQESLQPLQWIGAVIVLGAAILISQSGKRRTDKPDAENLPQTQWVLLLVAATILASGSTLYDKHLLQGLNLNPVTLQASFYFYNTLFLGGVCYFMSDRKRPFQWRSCILTGGLLLFLADGAHFLAVSDSEAMISLISLFRRGSVLIPFLYGSFILKEGFSKQKTLFLTILIIGLILLIIG